MDDGELEEVIKGGEYDTYMGTDSTRMITGVNAATGKSIYFTELSAVSLSNDKTLWKTYLHNGGIGFTKNNAVAYDNMFENEDETSALRCFDIKTGKKKRIYRPGHQECKYR